MGGGGGFELGRVEGGFERGGTGGGSGIELGRVGGGGGGFE